MIFRIDLSPLSVAVIFIVVYVSSAVDGQRQAQCCQEYCYELDRERVQSAHFGSKTSYSIAKGQESGRQFLVPNCNPVKIWLLSRHGTRLPKAKYFDELRGLENLRDEIITNYEKRHSKPDVGAMCDDDLELLKRWRWNTNITADYSEFLTTEGWNELKFLGIRLQRSFPSILENIYDRNKFQFRYTNTQRTEASYKAFVEGLFGPNAHEHINVQPPPSNDTLLRPYDSCGRPNGKEDGSEYQRFLKSRTMTQLVSDVSARLGYKYPLKVEQVLTMFDDCRYQQAWELEKPSAWCAAFTPSQIDDLEYLEDLSNYYKASYGRKANSRIACAAVKDMIMFLESRNLPQSVTYFTHTDMIFLFLTALQAAEDSDTLRADNYYSMLRRKFRSSELSPFAANLAAIKYECPNDNERAKVMFFLNEKPLDFNWCKVGLCNLSDVKEKYKEFIQADCNNYYCSSNQRPLVVTMISLFLPIISILFF